MINLRPTGRVLLATALAAAFTGSAVPVAHAEFGPIELVSKSAKEQAGIAIAPAISADGRYVAFAGRIGGHVGVFRKDLQTGGVASVLQFPTSAPGESVQVANPSISADGRYVAFTTTEPLDAADDPGTASSDVYVADMSTTTPTYELASAGDGSDQALGGDSAAAGRVALSEDGSRIVFTNGGEVYVRDLGTTTTVLITVRRDPITGVTSEPVPGGGVASGSEVAAISGDGSTVAWVGSHLTEQVPMLGDEEARVRAREYHEPLWRRVPTPVEESPPTRRIVGGGDPLAPGCPPGGTLSDPACQGPFPAIANGRAFLEVEESEGAGWGTGLPQLSRDGNTVALVGNPDEQKDLFVVDMGPGLSRRQAVRRLTQWVNVAPEPRLALDEKFTPFNGPISGCAISPDGNRIAFTTRRQVFPLAPPSLVSPPPTASSTPELYQLDLTGDTIERVTPGGSAGSSLGGQQGASSPSYSRDGRFLSFASDAYNLVAGDTNENPDAFVVESPLPAPIDESKISPRPAALVVKPLWRMTVDAASLPNGRIKVTVGLPGAGTVTVQAAARVGRRPKLHRVASAQREAPTAGLQRLELGLPRKLHGLARKKGGLYAQLDVDFSGPGGRPLRAAVDARFVVHRKKVRRGKR